jgi:hypothetical protein
LWALKGKSHFMFFLRHFAIGSGFTMPLQILFYVGQMAAATIIILYFRLAPVLFYGSRRDSPFLPRLCDGRRISLFLSLLIPSLRKASLSNNI